MKNKIIYLIFGVLMVSCVGNTQPKYSEKENIEIENCVKKNDIKSCLTLGVLYELSDLDKTEYRERLSFHGYRGDFKISHMMDKIYQENKSISLKNNRTKAIEMYKRACNYGSSKGCLLVAYQYQFTKKDILLANKYYVKACKKLENKNDCNMLAKFYLDKRNFNKNINYRKNIAYIEKACELKSQNSCMFLGGIYKKGKVVSLDQDKSLNFYLDGIMIHKQLVKGQYNLMIKNMKKACKEHNFMFTTLELKKALNIRHFPFRENYKPSSKVGKNECKMIEVLINKRK